MPPLLPIAEARARVLAATTPLDSESVYVGDAFGRVLAQVVLAAGDLPPFSASAMDGYAVQAGPAGRQLAVIGESRAGSPSEVALQPDSAIRISTGAELPRGADAVIRQEDVGESDGRITTQATVGSRENVRPAGEVFHAGQAVLSAGTRLGAAELAVAVSAGARDLLVGGRPRVAVLSTGDELREPGEPLAEGEIHNSNAPMLVALAVQAGALSAGSRILPDDPTATETGLREALGAADVVVVSGGVSVGPHDHVKPALTRLGVVEDFWRVALQPGKPTWFGVRERTLVFGLPGNPVSAAVTFTLFVAPALFALQGAADPGPAEDRALLGVEVRRNPMREQAIRVRLHQDDETAVAVPNGPQDSHQITSLVGADALAMIPAGDGTLPAGTAVTLHPLPR
jgi:molybdopterin molybdotransferase